ncbi:hypothetical protein [Thermomonospora cellulosilytica]|uniref:Carboxypeptidase regulatory-like domain-containing protein n=1 Tax=Thermomonospora cellulosilytica TaxID=1411118 RepID=A0A7W3R761_9ACTN|nr:hypothetical protein [Thermomonospora cellulosilytica]MBA9002281.1 hypothetical protein [Thermomonospora cellulosilytica]
MPLVLIPEVRVRRLATVLTALAIAPAPAFLALTPPPAIAATVFTITAGGQAVEGGYHIRVSASSDQAIERVQVVVRHPDGGATTVEDFQIEQRSTRVWEALSASPISLTAIGDHTIDVSVWDATGARTDKANAGVIARRLATRFEGVTVTPTQIDIIDDQVSVSGRLLRHTTEGTEEPYPGATVQVDGLPYTFVTDEQGAFSGTIRMGGVSTVRLIHTAGPVYGGSSSPGVALTYRRLQTRLSIGGVPEWPLVGDTVTVTGRLERQRSTGEWEPFGDRIVEIWFSGYRTDTHRKVTEVRTGADGRYSVPVTIPESGTYWAYFNHNVDSYYRHHTSSSAGTRIHYASYPTEIIGSNADPEPVGAGSKVTMRAQVVRRYAPADRAVVAGVPVQLWFSPDGREWRHVVDGRTDDQGRLTLAGVASRDGYWRAYYGGGPFGNASTYTQDAESIGWADYVDVRYRTRVSSFNASPEPVTKGRPITVQGRLDRLVGSSWKALTGASVTVYFKPNGSTTWTAKATVKTGSTGWFKKSFTASKDGTWMVKYNGSSANLGVQGPGDYVDVR